MASDDSEHGGRLSSNDPESIASIPIGRIHNSWFKSPYDMAHIIWVILNDRHRRRLLFKSNYHFFADIGIRI